MILTKNNELFNKIYKENEDFNSLDLKNIIKNYFKCLFITFSTNSLVFKYFSSLVIRFGFLNNIKLINNFSTRTGNELFIKILKEENMSNEMFPIRITVGYETSSRLKFGVFELIKGQN